MTLFHCLHRAILWGITVYILAGLVYFLLENTVPEASPKRIEVAISFAMCGYLWEDLVRKSR
jgi:hypothetical protein